jgi:hypothetical protein
MTPEDEAFNKIERRSKVKQALIVHKSKEAMLMAEVAVLTEMVRVLSDKVNELQAKQKQGEPVAWLWELTGEVTTDPDRADGMWKPLYTTPQQRTWVGLMRGVRVEGDTVVISVHYGNDAARQLCGDLIKEMNNERT